jgi:hypothetical protein
MTDPGLPDTETGSGHQRTSAPSNQTWEHEEAKGKAKSTERGWVRCRQRGRNTGNALEQTNVEDCEGRAQRVTMHYKPKPSSAPPLAAQKEGCIPRWELSVPRNKHCFLVLYGAAHSVWVSVNKDHTHTHHHHHHHQEKKSSGHL